MIVMLTYKMQLYPNIINKLICSPKDYNRSLKQIAFLTSVTDIKNVICAKCLQTSLTIRTTDYCGEMSGPNLDICMSSGTIATLHNVIS